MIVSNAMYLSKWRLVEDFHMEDLGEYFVIAFEDWEWQWLDESLFKRHKKDSSTV